jgi:hypothetical protein
MSRPSPHRTRPKRPRLRDETGGASGARKVRRVPVLTMPAEWLQHLQECGQCQGYATGDADERCERGEFLYREYRAIMELRRPRIPKTTEAWLDPHGSREA